MQANEVKGATALVTGASRGFGRAIAAALDGAGAAVVGVARDGSGLDELRAELGDSFIPVSADAADPTVAGQLIDAYRPTILVLNAGAAPLSRPLQQHTWQTFSRNWDVDVQQVFHWLREALLVPLAPGSTVITMSSGAALRGSPLSGGYAGSKATIRFITSYAAAESERGGDAPAEPAAGPGDQRGRALDVIAWHSDSPGVLEFPPPVVWRLIDIDQPESPESPRAGAAGVRRCRQAAAGGRGRQRAGRLGRPVRARGPGRRTDPRGWCGG